MGGKPRTKPTDKALSIDFDGEHLHFRCLNPARATYHGMGLFLEKLADDEIEITKAAHNEISLYSVTIDGPALVEVFAEPRVIAWLGHKLDAAIPTAQANINRAARAWLISLSPIGVIPKG